MQKFEDSERKPTAKIDARELRRLVVSLVVTVDEEDKPTPFEGVPAARLAADNTDEEVVAVDDADVVALADGDDGV